MTTTADIRRLAINQMFGRSDVEESRHFVYPARCEHCDEGTAYHRVPGVYDDFGRRCEHCDGKGWRDATPEEFAATVIAASDDPLAAMTAAFVRMMTEWEYHHGGADDTMRDSVIDAVVTTGLEGEVVS